MRPSSLRHLKTILILAESKDKSITPQEKLKAIAALTSAILETEGGK